MEDMAFMQKMHTKVNGRLATHGWHRISLMGDPRPAKELIAYVALAIANDKPLAWYAAPCTTQMNGVHMLREMGRLTLPPAHCQRVDWVVLSDGQLAAMPSSDEVERITLDMARQIAEDEPFAVFALLQNARGDRSFEFWHPPLMDSEVLWRILNVAAKRAFG